MPSLRRGRYFCLLFFSAVFIANVSANHGGKLVVVNHDEWSFAVHSPFRCSNAEKFAQNVANYFTNGLPGNILIYSNNFGLTDTRFISALRGACHTVTVSRNVIFTVPELLKYDAIYLAGDPADQNILIDYVNQGGHVYLAGGAGNPGGPAAEAAQWNTFLAAFDMRFDTEYNGIGECFGDTSSLINSTHPIFDGVRNLYFCNGNSITATGPNSDIILTQLGHGLIAVHTFPSEYTPTSPHNHHACEPINQPPVVACRDLARPAFSRFYSEATLNDINRSASDPNGDPLMFVMIPPGPYFPIGVHTARLMVTDPRGLTAFCDATITVEDKGSAEVFLPPRFDFVIDPDNCVADIDLPLPYVRDNLGIASVTNNAPTTFPIGNTTVTWTVRDASSNTSMVSQQVRVADRTPPLLIPPSPLVFAPDSGSDYATIENPGAFGEAYANDSCGAVSVQFSGGTVFYLGENEVEWTATDQFGNSTTKTQSIFVAPKLRPSVGRSFSIEDSGIFSRDGNIHLDNINVASIVGQVRTNDGHVEVNNIARRLDVTGNITSRGKIDLSVKNTATGSVAGNLLAMQGIKVNSRVTVIGSPIPNVSIPSSSFPSLSPPSSFNDTVWPRPIVIRNGNLQIDGSYRIAGTVYYRGNIQIKKGARLSGAGALVAGGNIQIEEMEEISDTDRIFFFSINGEIKIGKTRKVDLDAFFFAPRGNIHFENCDSIAIDGAIFAEGNVHINNVKEFRFGTLAPPVVAQPPDVFVRQPERSNEIHRADRPILLIAQAYDWFGEVTKVEFFSDGDKVGEDTSSPYFIYWTNAPSGTHAIRAVAHNDAGVSATSNEIPIIVSQPPVVSIVSPAVNMAIASDSSFEFTVSALDPDGTVSRVEFYVNGEHLGDVTSVPYNITLSRPEYNEVGPEPSVYTLMAKAVDNNGVSTSRSVKVRFNDLPAIVIAHPFDSGIFQEGSDVTFIAAAGDRDALIRDVEFSVNNVSVGKIFESPYRVTWRQPPPGRYALSATATDSYGGQATSYSDITINALPSVAIINPIDGSFFQDRQTVPVRVETSDSDGVIAFMELLDSGLICPVPEKPFLKRLSEERELILS